MLSLILAAALPGRLGVVLDDPKLDGAIVSACVTDLEGHVLFERNSAVRVMPASDQKLLSAAFALWKLGPNHRPTTSFWKEPDRVVIESDGDPLMTREDLLSAAKRLGLERRDRRVEVKEAYTPGFGGGWEIEDLPNKFAAPVTAFTVDRGSFAIWNQNGQPRLLPEPYGVRISRGLSLSYDPFVRRVIVPKNLPKETKRLDTLSLPRSDEAAASLLGRGFQSTETVPSRQPDLVLQGRPVMDMLRECLPPSDNNIAEHLLLMATTHGRAIANPYPEARKDLRDFLERVVGTPPGDILPYDGSGLSKENVLTTRAIATLLVWANRQPTASGWRASLAQSGVGTLRTRLKGVTFSGKTGSLNRVLALSGYVRTAKGDDRVVSLVMNHFSCEPGEVRAIQDAFMTEVSNNAP